MNMSGDHITRTAGLPAGWLIARPDEVRRAVRAAGNGRGILLAGSPGIGKTFVLDEVGRRLDAAHPRSIVVRASAEPDDPPLAALHRAAGLPRGSSVEELEHEISVRREDTPTAVLVDDAHLLDLPSALFLSQAVRSNAITLLAAVDPGYFGDDAERRAEDEVTALWFEGHIDRFDLRPLDAEHARLLLDDFLDGRPLAVLSRKYLLQQAAGVPLLIRELAAMQVNSAEEDSRQVFAPDVRLSPRLLDVARRRVARLGDADQEALLILGRLGQVHWERAVSLIGYDALMRLICGDHVVYVSTLPPVVRAHPLDSQAVSAARAGTATGACREVVRSVLADTIAGAPLTPTEAVLAAQEWTTSEGALDDAVREWGSGLVADVLTLAAGQANGSGSPRIALALARRATSLSPSMAAATETSKALFHLVDEAAAWKALESSDDGAPDRRAAVERIRWAALLSARTPASGSSNEIRPVVSGQPEDLDIEMEERIIGLWGLMRNLRWREGFPIAQAIVDDLRLSRLVRLQACGFYGVFAALNGDRTGLERAALIAAELAAAGDHFVEPSAALESTVDAFALIAFGSVIAVHEVPGHGSQLERFVEEALHARSRLLLATLSAVSGALAAERGALSTAEDELCTAESLFTPRDDSGWRVWLRCQRAAVLASLGRPAEAAEHLSSATGLEGADAPWSRLWRNQALLRVRAAEGDGISARRLALQLAGEHPDSPVLTIRFLFEAVRAGEPADQLLPALEESAAKVDFPSLTAMADYVRATAVPDAVVLERAAGHLSRLGLLPPATTETTHTPSGRTRLTGLSARECEVATLAAAGRANREIAAELFLSVRTVESHIQKAMGKLGLSSRNGLRAFFGPDELRKPSGAAQDGR